MFLNFVKRKKLGGGGVVAIFVFTLLFLCLLPTSFLLAEPEVTAGGGIVPCGGTGQEECDDFNYLIQMIQNVIDFLIFYFAIPLTVLSFGYAGFLYLTAGVDSEKIGKAHQIFKIVFTGLFFTLGAWLIVHLITSSLLDESFKSSLIGDSSEKSLNLTVNFEQFYE